MGIFDKLVTALFMVALCLLTLNISTESNNKFTCEQLNKTYYEGQCISVVK